MAKYSEMSYAQALRKEPTNYKLRAMGKRKYDLKYKDGKVTISTKGEPKTREDFGVGKKRVIDSQKKKTLLKKGGLDREAKLALAREKEQANKKSSQKEAGEKKETKKDEKKSNRVPAERKAYENSKDSYLAIDRQTRSKDKDSKKRGDDNIPRQALENILTGTAGAGLLLGGYALKKVKEKKKADKLRMASEKLKNMKPAEQQKVLKETIKKTMDKMKDAKPSLKQKIKSRLAKLRQKLSTGLKRSGGGVGGNVNVTPGGTGNIPPIKGRFKKTDINL